MSKSTTYKKGTYRRIYKAGVIFLLCVVVFFLAHAVFDIWKKERIAQRNLSDVLLAYSKLDERHTELSLEMEALETDRGIEEAIHEKYRAVKDGEHLAVIIASDIDTSKDKTSQASEGFFARIKRFLGDMF